MSDKELISALILIIASLLKEQGKPFNMKVLRERVREHSNAECVALINTWVKSETGREALKRHLVDKQTFEAIAEEIDRSPKQAERIIKKYGEELYSHV